MKAKWKKSLKNHPGRSFHETTRRFKVPEDFACRFLKESGLKSVAKRQIPSETTVMVDQHKVKAALSQLKKRWLVSTSRYLFFDEK